MGNNIRFTQYVKIFFSIVTEREGGGRGGEGEGEDEGKRGTKILFIKAKISPLESQISLKGKFHLSDWSVVPEAQGRTSRLKGQLKKFSMKIICFSLSIVCLQTRL